jgi:CRP-like cAMP-binding protein
VGNTTLRTFSSTAFGHGASAPSTNWFADGQHVFSQGEPANAVFRVEQGTVKLTVRSKHGKNAVIAFLRAGECFGESCLEGNGSARRTATATAVHRSSVARVEKVTMRRRLRREPVLARLFISHLLLRTARSEQDHADLLLHSSERRLARLLLRLTAFTRTTRGATAVVTVDQTTLAEMVGTTRSRVSHFMNRFRKRGFIAYNGDLRVYRSLFRFAHATDTRPA